MQILATEHIMKSGKNLMQTKIFTGKQTSLNGTYAEQNERPKNELKISKIAVF